MKSKTGHGYYVLVLCAALLIASCGDDGSKSAGVDWSTVDWSSADALIEQTMDEVYCPGLAAAVVADGQTVWTGAYGWADVVNEVPVTADTPFLIASVSKAVTDGANVDMFFEPASNTGVVILMNTTATTQTELARREIQTHLLDLVEEQRGTR